MSNDHPKSEGVLFVNNDKQKDSHPDHRGHILVTKGQVKRIVEMAKAGLEPKLQVAAWNRRSKGGADYMYLSTEAYMKDDAAPPEPEPKEEDWNDDDIPF